MTEVSHHGSGRQPAESGALVVYARQPGIGWQSVSHFANLTARLLGAPLKVVDSGGGGLPLRKLGALGARRRKHCKVLLIIPIPEYLYTIIDWTSALRGVCETSVLVTDSFWVERIPRIARRGSHFSRIFIHDGELVDEWARLTGRPVSWIPVGSDVLGHGSGDADRPLDLLRVGRQPPAWDNDHETAVAAARQGLYFSGRPNFYTDPEVGYAELQRSLSRAKTTLAFSNRIHRAPHNHPSREFVSYRWVDGISAGAVVAGTLPRTMMASEILWPGSTIEIQPNDLEAGLGQVREFVANWSPDTAKRQHLLSLERLDWRWRIKKMCVEMGVEAPLLDLELQQLRETISHLQSAQEKFPGPQPSVHPG